MQVERDAESNDRQTTGFYCILHVCINSNFHYISSMKKDMNLIHAKFIMFMCNVHGFLILLCTMPYNINSVIHVHLFVFSIFKVFTWICVFTTSEAAPGDACNQTTGFDCAGPNENCTSDICECNTGYFNESGVCTPGQSY